MVKRKSATFRTVNYVKLNVLIIPRQFLKWFNSNEKVTLEFSKSSNVVFIKSNLNNSEILSLEQKQREHEQQKTFRVHSAVEKAVCRKKDEWIVEGSCSQCGKIGMLYNGKSGLVCSECLRKEGLF